MKPVYLSCAMMLFAAGLNANSVGQPALPILEGSYLGQMPPGLTPEVFAPGVISTGAWEISGVFTPDLKEFYYIREVEEDNTLQQQFVVYKQQKNRWYPEIISPRVGQPSISPDGKTMYLGRRYKQRKGAGWSAIKSLGPLFEQYRIMRLTASAQGTLVFDEARNNSVLRYSRIVDGKREAPKPLPKTINTGEYNAHPFIAPDESYIIWDGQRDSPVRNADLFISFRQQDGSWGEAIAFGDDINTAANEGSARVTPDGKYLFFRRKVGSFEWTDENGKVETLSNADIFWVDAQVIENLRPQS